MMMPSTSPFWLALAAISAVSAFESDSGVLVEKRDQVPIGGSNNDKPGFISRHGVGRLPALGWNSWNAYRCDINEEKVLAAANKLVSLGLKDAGYNHVNIDDCWSVKNQRDSKTQRMIPDPEKFPSGIKGVADKIHSMGLKFGIYSSAGTHTCAGYPASLGFEDVDAQSFSDWGVDYLKYDNCNVPVEWADECNYCLPDSQHVKGPFPNGTCPSIGNQCASQYDWTRSNSFRRFSRMRDALENVDRPIEYALCQWGTADVQEWGNLTATSWRASADIFPNWPRVMEMLNIGSFKLDKTDFWGHSDNDMLEVGNGDLSVVQTRTHFALWAAMKTPLLIGTDLSLISSQNLDLLKNPWLLAFNQDPLVGPPIQPYKWGTNKDWTWNATYAAEFWSGKTSVKLDETTLQPVDNSEIAAAALASSLGQTTKSKRADDASTESKTEDSVLVIMGNWDQNDTKRRTALWSEIPDMPEGKTEGSESLYEVIDIISGTSQGCFSRGYTASVKPTDVSALWIRKCR